MSPFSPLDGISERFTSAPSRVSLWPWMPPEWTRCPWGTPSCLTSGPRTGGRKDSVCCETRGKAGFPWPCDPHMVIWPPPSSLPSLVQEYGPQVGKPAPHFPVPKADPSPYCPLWIHLHSHSLNPCAHKPHTTPPLASHSVGPGPATSHPPAATQTGRTLGPTPSCWTQTCILTRTPNVCVNALGIQEALS